MSQEVYVGPAAEHYLCPMEAVIDAPLMSK